MTTPDLRPISTLTPEILSSSSHWCLFQEGNATVIQSECLGIDAGGLYGIVASDSSIVPKNARIRVGFVSAQCYPCTLQPNGLIVPEPWPVMDGEEEIEEWSALNIASVHKGYRFVPGVKDTFHAWWDGAMRNGRYKGQIKIRSGFHPAPRKGKTGIVWVWEKDRC